MVYITYDFLTRHAALLYIHSADQNYSHTEQSQLQRCILGMQLCSEKILSQREIISIQSSEHLALSFDEHDVHLNLPQEALNDGISIEVAFAPYKNTGPFIFPEGMVPISPIVWFCSQPQKKFSEPATIQLPHCFECKSSEDSKSLNFLKAEHNDVSVSEDGQTVIEFKPVDKAWSEFPLGCKHGTLRDHHFCIYCVAYLSQRERVLQEVQYHLTIQKPMTYPRDETKKIYCILHYNLLGCKKVYCA